MTDHGQQDHSAVHRMLIVGESKVFLSHLPVFHAPHHYEILLEVTLREDGGDPAGAYREDRQRSGERMYTWMPEPFMLREFIAPADHDRVMRGRIFRGHFERGGTPITSDRVYPDVARVLYCHKLTPSSETVVPLHYVLFGSAMEPFVADLVTRPPDYDHILSVDLPSIPPRWDGLSLLLEIVGQENTLDQRLHEANELDCISVINCQADAAHLAVRREFYLETGDLAS